MLVTAFQIKSRWCSYLLLPFALLVTLISLIIFGVLLLCTIPAAAITTLNLAFPNSIIPKIDLCYGFPLFSITIVALPHRQYQFGPRHAPWLCIQPKPSTFLRIKARKIVEPWELCKNIFRILQKNIQFTSANINTDIQFTNSVQVLMATLILSFIESWIPESRIKTNFFCCHSYQIPQTNIKLNLECECRCRLLPMIFSLYRQLNKHME